MLRMILDDLKKHYYDPKFHNVDLDARFAEAEKRINAANSLNMAFSNIAAAIADLNDSHTSMYPPPRPYVHDYGWRMQFFGDKGAFITAVRPGSDAENKGIKPGDQILALNGFQLNRADFWKFEYVYWILRPQPSLHLQLKSPGGAIREVDPQAHFRTTKKEADLTQGEDLRELYLDEEREELSERPQSKELDNNVVILRLRNFEWDPDSTGALLSKLHSRSAAVIDLRGNPGGYVQSLTYFTGCFFDHEVKIADRIGRKAMKPSIAKPFGHPFAGKVIVLIDSQSASAAELFARVLQLQNRATTVGDRSEGAVMESREYPHQIGADTVTPFEVSITEADMIMTDGKSLEHVGVTPDVIMLPSPEDLAAGRDPVLAHAAELAGAHLTPEDAGKLFPIEWTKN
jgi:C-terminal processing protease CtpA/Prc